MNANQAALAVHTMCRVLDVSASGFYAWRDRKPSMRAIEDAVLTERMRAIHAASDATYGMPRVRAELMDQGSTISRKRVARLMRCAHLRGVSRRRGFVVTTQRDKQQCPAPDLVNRNFVADAPNRLWVVDMTYVPTWAGFIIFLAVVLGVWSRRVVGSRAPITPASTTSVPARPHATAGSSICTRISRGDAIAVHEHHRTEPHRGL